MRVYHFLNREFGLQDIERHRLKIARLHELNDPFELGAPTLKHPAQRRAFLNWKGDLSQIYGLLCFSEAWSNPVQWGHYAAGHRGLCLGFDVRDELLTKVRYQAERLEIDGVALRGGGLGAEEIVMKMISTKFDHWSYECEQRCWLTLEEKDIDGLYFAPFGPDLDLREVIVGYESTITRAELSSALGPLAGTVEVAKARLAFSSFRVVKQLNSRLWI